MLNIGVITGLPIAIAAFFYANRLPPVALAEGNWIYAGFDLTMLGLAALSGLTGWYASRTPTRRKPAKRKAPEVSGLPAEAERA